MKKEPIPVYVVPHPGFFAGLLCLLICVVFLAFWKAALVGIGCWILFAIGEGIYRGWQNARIQKLLQETQARQADYIAGQLLPQDSIKLDNGRMTPFAPTLHHIHHHYGHFIAVDTVNHVLKRGLPNGTGLELIDLKNLIKVEEDQDVYYRINCYFAVPGKRRPAVDHIDFDSAHFGRLFFEALDDVCYELHGIQGVQQS